MLSEMWRCSDGDCKYRFGKLVNDLFVRYCKHKEKRRGTTDQAKEHLCDNGRKKFCDRGKIWCDKGFGHVDFVTMFKNVRPSLYYNTHLLNNLLRLIDNLLDDLLNHLRIIVTVLRLLSSVYLS